MTALTFRVIGTPAPQGSKRHVGHGVMIESSKAVRPWRQAVAQAAAFAHGKDPGVLDGPVRLWVEFVLPRPTSASRKRLALGPCRKPDLDKLLRSTLDGITEAGVWTDDARVVEIRATKRYAEPRESLGASVSVAEIAP